MQPAPSIEERLDAIERQLANITHLLQSQHIDLLAQIERHLIDLNLAFQRQEAGTAQVLDTMTSGQNRTDWDHVQSAQLLRILSRDIRELRASLICSLITDGPINAQLLHALLRQTPADQREVEPLNPQRQHNS